MPREMFAEPERRRGSPLAALLSLVVHAAIAVVVAWLALLQVTRPAVRLEQTLTFLRVSVPSVPFEPIEALRNTPPPEPDPKPVAAVPEPVVELPPEPEAAPPEPPPPPPPAPRPEVKVGTFDAPQPTVARVQPRQVQQTGFDRQEAVAPELRMRTAETGLFDSNSGEDARPGTDRPTAVVAGAFDGAQAAAGAARPGRTVTSAGFGGTAPGRAPAPATRSEVKPAGFADAPPPPAAGRTQPRQNLTVTPVEVTFKPTPSYSEEARKLRIEGEVTLEVEFSASGRVRVLRVVRGLGHGLDEAAMRAAEQIKFKPAQAGGQPVDFRASVQIVFRLT